jgi:hypothetical protein
VQELCQLADFPEMAFFLIPGRISPDSGNYRPVLSVILTEKQFILNYTFNHLKREIAHFRSKWKPIWFISTVSNKENSASLPDCGSVIACRGPVGRTAVLPEVEHRTFLVSPG